ncbi:MAG: ABC transporter ATP-binding protein [Anaerolineae bacterium]|nr:energy-coupling factor ABC transporter ATP-binding protein [Thermoflexales bacterium]MDW8394992.1 ABC transporter ATP-binding protein [Anaerolineae bacterium]
MIAVEQLTVRYFGRRAPSLSGVNLRFNEGETVLLLGPSGCGKSTLALTLNGLIPHSQDVAVFDGRVLVDGQDTRQTSPAQLSQRVGIVFQDPEAQFVMLDVESEVAFGLENLCLPLDEIERRVQRALAQVNLTSLRKASVWSLSGGQKQRVALAALLAMQPRTLVFDEPTAHLDPVGVREVFEMIAALKRKGQHTLVLIEHRLDELMPLIDRVVVLDAQGAVVADGAPSAVFNDHAEMLDALGVWVPQVTRLAQRLGVHPLPITLEEAERRLRGLLRPQLPLHTQTSLNYREAASVVRIHNLSYRYGSELALDDVSLEIPAGSFTALIGANGAGKTTLLRCIAGLLTVPEGTIALFGKDASRLSPLERARWLGMVFQNPEHQFVAATVEDELALSLRQSRLPAREVKQRVEAMLARFKLTQYAKANPFTLSHGEKRRLSVATMLMMNQPILLLDEPTFGQDQQNAEAIAALLRELHAEGRTIIVVTHDMALVAECATHVAVMSHGQVRFWGSAREAFAQPDVLEQANLVLPPLARLARRLGIDALTLDELVAALRISMQDGLAVSVEPAG